MEDEIFESPQELLKAKQLERQIRKGKKKRSFFKALQRFCLGVLVLFGMYYFCSMDGWYLPKNTFKNFDPARIQVVDNKIVKTDKIKSIVKDFEVERKPVFMTNLDELENKIKSLAPVKSVYIRRYAFPARVLIIIREATPVITVSPDAKVKPVAAFTKGGRLIEGADYLPLPDDFKTTLVLSYGNKGDDYRKWDADKILNILKVTKYVETFSHERVEYVDLKNPKDIYVKIESTTIRLGQFDDKIFDRIRRIPTILPEVQKIKGKVKYVDLSWEKVNYLKLE